MSALQGLPPPDAGEYTGWKIIVSTAFSFAIATTGLLLRFASRWLCRKRLELNDYLIIIAYIFKLGIDVGSIMLIEYGIGKNVTAIYMNNPQNITKYLKVLWIGPIFYAGAIGFIKLSILALYWSAFPRKYMKVCVNVLSAVVIAWTIAVMLVAIFSCLPIKASWTPTLRPSATCIQNVPYYYGSQIPNIITDFAILFLPLKAVYDLHMPMKQTLQLSAVLCLALVTCAFDIVRMVVLTQLSSGGNFTKDQVGLSIWTDIEPSVALLVACMPIMRPLFRPVHFWKLRNQSVRSDSYSDASPSPPNEKSTYTHSHDVSSSDASPARSA